MTSSHPDTSANTTTTTISDPEKHPHLSIQPTPSQPHLHHLLHLLSDPLPPNPPPPAPDGGLLAWSQVLATNCTIASTWGYVTCFGVFQTHFEATLPQSDSAISWIGSLQIFLLFALSCLSGRALDAGFLRASFVAGMALQLTGIFAFSAATEYWQIMLAQGVCTGVGNALLFCPAVGVVATYFDRKRTWAIAVAASGSALGSMLFAGTTKVMLPVYGLPWTVRTLGFIVLALDLVALALLKPRLPPRRTGPLIEWGAFTEAPFVLFVGGMFGVFWGLYFAFFYVGTYARDKLGFDYSASVNNLLLINGIGVVGRLAPGYIATWTGALNAILVNACLIAVVMYTWLGVASSSELYAFSSFYGLFAAGIQSLWPGTLASLTTDQSKAGTRMGMGFSLVSLACLTGTPIGGALIQADGSAYTGAICFAASAMMVGCVLIVGARVARGGWAWRAKC